MHFFHIAFAPLAFLHNMRTRALMQIEVLALELYPAIKVTAFHHNMLAFIFLVFINILIAYKLFTADLIVLTSKLKSLKHVIYYSWDFLLFEKF